MQSLVSLFRPLTNAMGLTSSQQYISDLSDEESDIEESDSEKCEHVNQKPKAEPAIPKQATCRQIEEQHPKPAEETSSADLSTDAAAHRTVMPEPEIAVTLEKLDDIEGDLDPYELVSLVFLLYEPNQSKLALQELNMWLMSKTHRKLLYQWAKHQNSKGSRWQLKLVESLCIIQNYKVLKELGFGNKIELKGRFCPNNANITEAIDKNRKILYCIAEQLDRQKTITFLSEVRKMFGEKGLSITEYGDEYLELYFLDWEHRVENSLQIIQNILKLMDLDSLSDLISGVVPIRSTEETKIGFKRRALSTFKDTTEYPEFSNINNSYSGPSDSLPDILPHKNDGRYIINPDKPGIVLIINQIDFYTEIDEKYFHLLHPNNNSFKLETRLGTELDRSRLKSMFEKFNFRVIIEENLAHYDIINSIINVVNQVSTESSLFVIILSHGEEGAVYGSNSCYIKVKQIEKIIMKQNRDNLRGKPKVLILQSCQGTQCQQLEENESDDDEIEEIAIDGPKKVPPTADMLTLWATVPGYAAIRNIKRGSWLIQTLCDEIDAHWRVQHFSDICTKVLNKVTSKEWIESTEYASRTNTMTPVVVSTFRKSFYLPSPR